MGCLKLAYREEKTKLQVVYGGKFFEQKSVQRFLSVDPITKKFPELTPYQYASNTPISAVDIDGLEGLAGDPNGIYHANKDLYDDLTAGKATPRVVNSAKVGEGIVIVAALATDAFLTKGWATKTLIASEVFGAIQHNTARTEEGRKLQNQTAKENLTDAFLLYGGGKILGQLGKAVKFIVPFTPEASAAMDLAERSKIFKSGGLIDILDGSGQLKINTNSGYISGKVVSGDNTIFLNGKISTKNNILAITDLGVQTEKGFNSLESQNKIGPTLFSKLIKEIEILGKKAGFKEGHFERERLRPDGSRLPNRPVERIALRLAD